MNPSPRTSLPACPTAPDRTLRSLACGLALLLPAVAAGAQATARALPVPSTSAGPNGNQALGLPGLPDPLRVQILVDPVHLQPLVGQTISGLRFRRQAHPRPFAGGGARWTVQLSIAPHAAAAASPDFAANAGPAPVALPSQVVLAPPSPGVVAPWDPSNTLQVACAPFPYSGGTLCIDIQGRPEPGLPTTDWPVDAELAPHPSTLLTIGPGCGPYQGGNWSFTEADTLVAGQTARFSAFGTPGAPAVLLINDIASPFVYDLTGIGAAPGCHLHVAAAMLQVPLLFSPPVFPTEPTIGGMAVLAIEVPRQPWFLGAPFTDQWADLGPPRFVVSAAHSWSIAATPPSAGVTTVRAPVTAGSPGLGEVLPDLAPVLQIVF